MQILILYSNSFFVGVYGLSCSFSEECAKLLRDKTLSKKFYDHLLEIFRKVIHKFSAVNWKNIDDLAEEFLQDFCEKLEVFCERILKNLDQIKSIDAYVIQSISNFSLKKLERLSGKEGEVLSLDREIDESSGNETFIEIIGYENFDSFAEIIAEDIYEQFLQECNKKKTDMRRYICFFIYQELYGDDKFADSSWSDSNKYKIRERTRKFIKEFAEKFSLEEKVLGLVLTKFMSEICEKMRLYR